jgi:predicted Co/Zn/Cd cation transporter (cation efflux family)
MKQQRQGRCAVFTMLTHSKYSEACLLRFSIGMGMFFTVLGISWGLVIQSGVVLFDGIYSGFSIILSILSSIVLRLLNRGDDENFQFGPMALEPLVAALKSIVIIGVCAYGIVTSVFQLLNGGWTPISSLLGMAYALVSIIVCLFAWLFLKTYGRNMPLLIIAESEQWLMDTAFSCIVLASFLASYLLSFTRLNIVVPFIDPGIVVLASLYFIRIPFMRFFSSMRELLMMAPPSDIQAHLVRRIEAIRQANHFEEAVVRSTKIGRELAVDIAFIVSADAGKFDIEELDKIRAEVDRSLSELGNNLWMNILFTKNRHWA